LKVLIGMDGGGTKTKCIAADTDCNPLHECTGGPSTFILIGTEKVCNTILELIDDCKNKLGFGYKDIGAVVIGSTGAGRPSDAARLENDFNKISSLKGITIPKFKVETDARIALEGALSGKTGSILIAGTGSIMFGKDSNGNIHRVGGYGRFIGDEGSGYMLGRKGLTAVVKEYDGRGEKTQLGKLLFEKFGLNDLQTLITDIYQKNFDIASVAPLVTQAAESGDEICRRIIEEETDELLNHISAMMRKMSRNTLDVSLIGSTIVTDNYFSHTFVRKVSELMPGVRILEPQYPPAMGAVLMAKELMLS